MNYKYGQNLCNWVVYSNVALRQSNEQIVDGLFDVFGYSFRPGLVSNLKRRAAPFYRQTYDMILDGLRKGSLIHADETPVYVRDRAGRCYVWVLANMERVIYLYSRSREGSVIQEALGGFDGVLVSDFYAGYESVNCPQQKCLIHLIRNMNDDIRKNPFDEELRQLVQDFGYLMQTIVETIDRYGLKRRHLHKHVRDVTRFYRTVSGHCYRSDVAQHYQQRLQNNRSTLFTFLEYDGVPWNNNNAENAIKPFVVRRRTMGAMFSEKGIRDYLTFLSIYQTLRYRQRSFWKFLLSGEIDIDEFCRHSAPRRVNPATIEKRSHRPTFERDHEWLRWSKQENLGPAAIRDRWNGMADGARKMLCPLAPDRIQNGHAGGYVVTKGLERARREITFPGNP